MNFCNIRNKSIKKITIKLRYIHSVVMLFALLLVGNAAYASQAPIVIVVSPQQEVKEQIDDADRIDEAIFEVNAMGGGTVLLLAGTYHVASPINVLSDVTLKGHGQSGDNATIIRLVDNAPSFNGTAGIVRLKNDEAVLRADKRVFNATIEDLFIDGNRDNQRQDVVDAEKKYGIYSEGDNHTIRRVTTANCMGYGFDPHGIKASDEGPAIGSHNYLIEDSISYNNLLDGFTLDHLIDSVFRNNLAYDNERHGINVVTDAENITISNSVSRNNGANGIMVQNGAASLTIVDNHIYNNTENGVNLRASDYNVVKENVIRNNGREAIRIRGSYRNQVLHNHFFENTTDNDSLFEIRLEEYDGIESTFNKVVYNLIKSTGRGVLVEQDSADFNKFLYNNYNTLDGTFRIVGENSLEFGNTQISDY
ncbi:MAG: right-handed parallel beta-helix repeat-containing protein [Aestuariibacter sp.]